MNNTFTKISKELSIRICTTYLSCNVRRSSCWSWDKYQWVSSRKRLVVVTYLCQRGIGSKISDAARAMVGYRPSSLG